MIKLILGWPGIITLPTVNAVYFLVPVSGISRKHQSIRNRVSPHQQTIRGESRSLLSSLLVQLDLNES